MRKALLWMMVSLDGYIEAPDRDISWHQVDADLHRFFNDQLRGMGAFLEGRVVYELMEDYWPTADADPDAAAEICDFAAIWRDMPKVVYTRTLDEVGPNATIVREVVPAEVNALKAQEGGDLVVGGAHLGGEFLRQGLIDECWIHVNPVVIGAGTPLFPTGIQVDLELLDTKRWDNGVVSLRYRVRNPA